MNTDGSTKRPTTKRPEERVAPGVVLRHSLTCAKTKNPRRACSCTPSYKARVRTGPTGQQRTVTETFGTLAEAVAWRDEAKRLQHSGEHPAPRRQAPAFAKVAADFLARAKRGRAHNRSGHPYSENTLATYETALRVHALVYVSARNGRPLAEWPVDDISTQTLQGLINHVTHEKSAATARQVAAAVMATLRDAYGRELIDQLPQKPALPAPPKRRDTHLTVEEADRVRDAAREDDAETGRSLMGPLVALLLGTGCRIGEALGMRWGTTGIDLEAGTVRVDRTTTKTDAGARTIGIDRETVTALREHRMATGRPADGELVFTRENGEPLDHRGRVRTGINRIRTKTGIDFTAHPLRHTQASWLAEAGYTPTDIAARLGHVDAAFTMRRYVHADTTRTAEEPTRLTEYRETQRREARKRNGG